MPFEITDDLAIKDVKIVDSKKFSDNRIMNGYGAGHHYKGC